MMFADFVHHLAAGGGDVLAEPVRALLAPVPDPGEGEAPPGAEKFVTILKWGKWLFTAIAVGAGLFVAGRMVMSHRRGDDTNVSSLGYWLAGCVLAGAAPHIVTALI